MHLIKLDNVQQCEKKLTQSVLQITQMLGLYQAELARILQLRCGDIAELAEAKCYLQKNTPQWQLAKDFVLLFEKLFEYCGGDEACMCHWLRKQQSASVSSPFHLLVDEQKMADVLQLLMDVK